MNIDPNEWETMLDDNLRSDKKARLYELSVFLFLIVPSMALSFFAVKYKIFIFF